MNQSPMTLFSRISDLDLGTTVGQWLTEVDLPPARGWGEGKRQLAMSRRYL